MYCDWAAASLRTKDGHLPDGLDINVGRFGIDATLSEIFKNNWQRYGGFCGQPEQNTAIERSADKRQP